jgi:NAD-dependent deacetylase
MTNLVVLTGAGISAESGISTFRDSNGLWNNHDIMAVASRKGFRENPEVVHGFYNARRAELGTVEPNDAHRALAALEEAWSTIGGFLLITQNVDNLHERAGSGNIAHIHGELESIRCSDSNCDHTERTDEDTTVDSKCPVCRSPMRPDIVWFGEMPKYLNEIEKVLDHTDVLISIGTSGSVMPASLFPAAVRMAKPDADIIEVNPVPTGNEAFNEVIEGSAVAALPELVKSLIAQYGK